MTEYGTGERPSIGDIVSHYMDGDTGPVMAVSENEKTGYTEVTVKMRLDGVAEYHADEVNLVVSGATVKRYREYRAANPLTPARYALGWVKTPRAADAWEEGRGHENWTREVDGFTVRLTLHDQSIFPMPDKRGNTDFGSYVDENPAYGDYGRYSEWRGNFHPPVEFPPLGIPYTSIRYSGPGWVQGEQGGYFIPDGIEDVFAGYRKDGQSRAVAWDLTKTWVEAQISMLFHSPLTNAVVRITASREGVELGSASMGTDFSGDDEGRDHVFQMVDEYEMIDEAIAEARETIERLTVGADS